MEPEEVLEFRVNPNHNYYACPVARPGSQLFIVRLEWEADVDQSDDEDLNDDQNEDNDFTLAMINFSGIQYILVGLDRRAHMKVLRIAGDLDLSIVQGYPLARISTGTSSTSDTSSTFGTSSTSGTSDNSTSVKEDFKHFPIRCAADSIFTVEGHIDINDPSELLIKKKQEVELVQAYLLNRYKEFEAANPNTSDQSEDPLKTDDIEKVEITMVDEPGYRCPPRKV